MADLVKEADEAEAIREENKKNGIYLVTFIFIQEGEKSFMVRKKTKKTNKVFFIPKSVAIEHEIYSKEKRLYKDCSYDQEKIDILLPKWFCKKALGFYR